jgi:hypothetical protein
VRNRSHPAHILRNSIGISPARAGWQHHPVSRSRWHFVVPCAATLSDATSLAGAVEAFDRGEAVTGAMVAEPDKVR